MEMILSKYKKLDTANIEIDAYLKQKFKGDESLKLPVLRMSQEPR